MTILSKRILQEVERLPSPFQEEVLNFVEFLLSKLTRRELEMWSAFSLESALAGMEDEEALYTLEDIRVAFK